jgi:hypothetical protein
MRPKRKPVPLRVQLEAAKRQLAHQMADDLVTCELQLDHDPALGLRPVNEAGTDYDPPQHDPRYLVWRTKADHLYKTTGRKGESKLSISGDGDVSRIAKAVRIEKKRVIPITPDADTLYDRTKPKRPWPQGRKIQSRNNLRKDR